MSSRSAPARLLSVRVQGFKSFAERTLVEFGPGISAIVGPNGSGKSNLADALRWALGEQGRSLRTRKSEDVIFAGSEKRAALGMADVALVLDNADGLLPIEFSVVELGRRLYRSGENDYLLNRQRVRLRDLVDLLDAAHLAENAFLFIGQGMVDQALALRPEERRPLFEEVAGVRRPERRRRKAEELLAESEANLARVEDILSELRPQARRLAAQAEQQATRATAAEDLANALVAAAHARWHEAAGRVAAAASLRERAGGDADAAMAELTSAEEAAAGLTAELAGAVSAERERRERHEEARSALAELRLREVTLDAETAALRRDRLRLQDERSAAETDLEMRRRELAIPIPDRDLEAEAALAEADRALGEALAELGGLQARDRARGEELAALQRAESVRATELETSRRRLAETERRALEEDARAREAVGRRAELEATSRLARDRALAAAEREGEAAANWEQARGALAVAEAKRGSTGETARRLRAAVAEAQGRVEVLTARVAEEEQRGIARAARRLGGRRVDDDLVVDPRLRPAVEAALADDVRAYVVASDAVADLALERGTVVPQPAAAGLASGDGRAATRLFETVASLGGGRLGDGLRRDPGGAAAHLLSRAVWLPDLASCLSVRPTLPPGWIAVVRDGSAVVTDLTVRFGAPEGALERKAQLSRLQAEVERLVAESASTDRALHEADAQVTSAAAALREAQLQRQHTEAERRRADEEDRQAARALESVVREAAWHEAQRERLRAEVDRLRATVGDQRAAVPRAAPGKTDEHGRAIESWQARVGELRERRDRLAADQSSRDAARREVEARRATASAAVALDEQRITAADRSIGELTAREASLAAERDQLAASIATTQSDELAARSALEELRAADAAVRERLSGAESAAQAARERLRTADERLRAAERAELEARLGLDGLREQLLVELAGLGDLGLRALGATVPATGQMDDGDQTADDDDDGTDAAPFEAALEAIASRWASDPAPVAPPSPGRLAALRRRFHDLGAANPFAVEEYEELRIRLEGLETQERDLRAAIAHTRSLIDELNRMIAVQFRTTFAALEAAFDARFRQLFGGGFARLALTDPEDLAATGIEIVARPPGKKAQALAMLSGGERALTAVALLFAMLEVRPVPFCVLDEVDAALDEANIGRFRSALRELAARTQFVVITHNRGTIEEADALYGVTVGDDSVSRVISLRLDEAQAIAEHREPSQAVAAG